jgi:hypothetical protein
VLARFDELIEQGESIKDACKRLYFAGSKRSIDPEAFESWKTNCLSLLKSTFGSSSPHFDSFVNRKFFDYYNSTQVYLGILKGAREDLSKGYFFHKDLMLSVNIFDSLLNRARGNLSQGNVGEAQAILKAVMAEILAKICENKNIPYAAEDSAGNLLAGLRRTDAVPLEVLTLLDGLREDFEGSAVPASDLERDLDTLLDFLDEFLGSQIIILN